MLVKELIEKANELKYDIDLLWRDSHKCESLLTKEFITATIAVKKKELTELEESTVSYVVAVPEELQAPKGPLQLMQEYVTTEPWPSDFNCDVCIVPQANEDKAFVEAVCNYCRLLRPKKPSRSKELVNLYPAVFAEVPAND